MNTSKLTLKDGKFYRDGELVPLEFGNWEQIRIMKEKQEAIAAMNGDGLQIDIYVDEIKTYEAKTDFRCISCNKYVYIDREVDDEDEKDSLIGVHSCFHCKQKYEILKNTEGDFIVKIKK